MPGNQVDGSVKLACLVAEVIGNGESYDKAVADAIDSFGAQVGINNLYGVDVLSHKIQLPSCNHRVVCKIAYDGAPL